MQPCPHFDPKIVQRGKRQSAVAAAAYQNGGRLEDKLLKEFPASIQRQKAEIAAQAAALLSSPAPLADVYKTFDKMESSHMEEIWSCVEHRADKTLASQLERAKTLVNEFCAYEYASQADFSDLSKVSIAYTTVGDGELPLQVYADLEGYKIERELDGKPLDVRQCASLDELIENELECLDFQELVAVSEDKIRTALAALREAERSPRLSVREQIGRAQEKAGRAEKKPPAPSIFKKKEPA